MLITGILKGMWVTIRAALFKKNVTLQYPKEKRYRPYRGLQKIDISNCIVCKLCERICPIGAMKIELKPGRERTRNAYDYDFTVNTGSCMWCGLCEEVCPKQAIYLTNTYDMSEYTKDRLIKKINMPIQPYKEKGKLYDFSHFLEILKEKIYTFQGIKNKK